MRWALLTDDHPPTAGGVSAFVDRVARELVGRGHQVTIVARHARDRAPIPGTRLLRVWGPRFSRHGGRWAALRAGTALRGADRVVAVTWPLAVGLPALGIPYDVVAHGSDVTCPPRDPAAFDRVWAGARRRFALSGFLAGQLAERGLRAVVLPAPVPIPVTAPAAPDPDRWVLVARATPLKGGDRFVRWVAAAGARGVVVGDGPALASWRDLARALGADVTFLGERPSAEIPAVWAGAGLLVLAPRAAPDGSGAEGLGLVAIEAAGAGVPAVGCRTGGVPEAVGPGLVVDDPDDAARCAAQIRAWWTPDRGAAAQAWCRAHHGVGRTVDALAGARAGG